MTEEKTQYSESILTLEGHIKDFKINLKSIAKEKKALEKKINGMKSNNDKENDGYNKQIGSFKIQIKEELGKNAAL